MFSHIIVRRVYRQQSSFFRAEKKPKWKCEKWKVRLRTHSQQVFLSLVGSFSSLFHEHTQISRNEYTISAKNLKVNKNAALEKNIIEIIDLCC